ncbi:hypothetical protein BKA93DRAFT_795151 [Sparassis latifolia]
MPAHLGFVPLPALLSALLFTPSTKKSRLPSHPCVTWVVSLVQPCGSSTVLLSDSILHEQSQAIIRPQSCYFWRSAEVACRMLLWQLVSVLAPSTRPKA